MSCSWVARIVEEIGLSYTSFQLTRLRCSPCASTDYLMMVFAHLRQEAVCLDGVHDFENDMEFLGDDGNASSMY
jgi:hypothetical protein